MNELVHQRKSKFIGQRRCAAQVRWSNEDLQLNFVDLAQRRCVHIFVGQTKMCPPYLHWSNEDLLLIFVDLAQRRCAPHLRWSDEDLLQIFVDLTDHYKFAYKYLLICRLTSSLVGCALESVLLGFERNLLCLFKTRLDQTLLGCLLSVLTYLC